MNKSEYNITINKVLKPTLIDFGFEEVRLKDCMKPEVLYRRKNLWFGTSWDWRDRYLEVNLGHLHWFKDVMPRVIVLGDYSSYSNEIKKIEESDKNYLEKVADVVANTIHDAITVYTDKYEQIKFKFLENNTEYSAVFMGHLGKEISDAELKNYYDR